MRIAGTSVRDYYTDRQNEGRASREGCGPHELRIPHCSEVCTEGTINGTCS